MASLETNFYVTIAETGADAKHLDELTYNLKQDLRILGVDSISRPTEEEAPESAKGDPFTWGALALVVAPTLIPKLLEFLQAWVTKKENPIRIRRPDGLEFEFTPEKKLSTSELISLAEKLAKPGS